MKTKPKLKTNRSITLSKAHSLLYRSNMAGAVQAAKNVRRLNSEIVALEREAGKLQALIQEKRDEFQATQDEQADLRRCTREMIGAAHGLELPEIAIKTVTDDGLIQLAWHEEPKPEIEEPEIEEPELEEPEIEEPAEEPAEEEAKRKPKLELKDPIEEPKPEPVEEPVEARQAG